MTNPAPGERPPVSADQLREIAEAVDGIGRKIAYVVWVGNKMQVTPDKPKSPDDVVFRCETKNDNSRWPKITGLHVEPPIVDAMGKPIDDAHKRFDAMFWSESSVRKFAVDYYNHVKPGQGDEIAEAFTGRAQVDALIHMPDTSPMFLTNLQQTSKTAPDREHPNVLTLLTLEEVQRLP